MPDSPFPDGMERQLALYRAGAAGGRPSAVPIRFEELEKRAAEILSATAFDYVAGAAGSEDTMRANRDAFRRWRILPRMLRDVAARDLSVELFGERHPAPLLVAPIGVQSLVHEEAETATARAAASLRIPLVLSTVSSRPLEEVAGAMGEVPHWFQLYWPSDRELAASFLSRAQAADFGAIVITLDAALLGWRERDLEHAYLPILHAEGLSNYFTDPVFQATLERSPEEDVDAAVMKVARLFANPSLSWDDLAFARDHTRLPILLKGILDPDDARRAVDHGVDGVVVSNHGGRQVDGAVAALDALPRVADAVGDRIPVLFDSGIRRGAELFKALALGARACLVGRPYVYGLAIGGEDGVREVLLNLLADFDLTLALSGCRSVAEVGRGRLLPAPPSPA